MAASAVAEAPAAAPAAVDQRHEAPVCSFVASDEADFGLCAICLEKIALPETALVKGCEHSYCVTCILRWASYNETPSCPQCKHPFEYLNIHRSLDGCIHDFLFEESVCLLLRASWFVPLEVDPHDETPDDIGDIFYQNEDSEQDDLDEEAYYSVNHSTSIRIGNRRWGDNGYVRAGRREARPVTWQYDDNSDAGPSHVPKKKEAAPTGRRARRAQKREAEDKANAAKHQQHLQRFGRI